MKSTSAKTLHSEEKKAAAASGMLMLVLLCLFTAAAVVSLVLRINIISNFYNLYWGYNVFDIVMLVIWILCITVVVPLLCAGLKVLKPNEAYVLTLFGKYYGTLRGPGFFFVNPFVTAATPSKTESHAAHTAHAAGQDSLSTLLKAASTGAGKGKKISLKAMTLNNEKQKINDLLGNPIEIGIVVIWRVVNTAKAIFNVDNYSEFLSIQCDSALRGIVRLYPYDVPGDEDEDERSLRGSSQEVADGLKTAIQEKVDAAGLEIMEARITHLAYAQEIAAAMLQRQQAAAIIAARSAIVKGAVDMVEMALSHLSEHDIVDLDNERKAAMVSNLLVVLCGNKDAQPVVNSGSLY
ncbi:MAG: SPFH domain-containing protein [Clostridiales Family XIII bacterium]|jgi:regulator of protease activity HflC (stomatin/prohibitin superfamily)|nr:SPFH domain-containing protein [Clostridiales Family XIII bacterium]